MIRCIPITACAECPYLGSDFGIPCCERMGGKAISKRADSPPEGPPPSWCPLPPHPTANEVLPS